MQVLVRVTRVTAERLWEVDEPLPQGYGVSLNLSIKTMKRVDDRAEGKFILDVSYQPPVGRIAIEGLIMLKGDPKELDKVIREGNSGKHPQEVVNAALTVGISEAVIASRSVGIPPPIPLPQPPDKSNRSGVEYTV